EVVTSTSPSSEDYNSENSPFIIPVMCKHKSPVNVSKPRPSGATINAAKSTFPRTEIRVGPATLESSFTQRLKRDPITGKRKNQDAAIKEARSSSTEDIMKL
ncbi:hypothetical protein BLOT_009245, partial [Blomia tropicalis]